MQLIKDFIEKSISQEAKLVLAKRFSNRFDPPIPFDPTTCVFMYKNEQNMFLAYVLGFINGSGVIDVVKVRNQSANTATLAEPSGLANEQRVQLKLSRLANRILVLESAFEKLKNK